jgi:hypothetical protein
MNTNNRTPQKTRETVHIPQFQVRSDVRSGADLETCQSNLNKWHQRYLTAYSQAHQRGCI